MDKPTSNIVFNLMSFNDHHIRAQNETLSRITGNGLFRLSGKGKRVYNFIKVGKENSNVLG